MSTSNSSPTDPLDVEQLRAYRGRRRTHQAVLDRIAEHLDAHDGFVAWSGGKDSTAVVSLTRQVDPNVPVVFYDCGLDYPETRAYIRQVTLSLNLRLNVIKTDPDLLTALVAAGSFDHTSPTMRLPFSLRERLLLEPARLAHDTFGDGSLWGVRSAESTSRRQLYRTHLHREVAASCRDCCTSPEQQRRTHGGRVTRNDGTVTLGPIWNWTTADVHEYLAGQQIPPNPLYAKLSRLGATADSARVDVVIDPEHLSHGQVARLRRGWPQLYARLADVLPRLSEFN